MKDAFAIRIRRIFTRSLLVRHTSKTLLGVRQHEVIAVVVMERQERVKVYDGEQFLINGAGGGNMTSS